MTTALRRLFEPLIENDDYDRSFIWIGNDGYSVCFNPNTGRLYGALWYDSVETYHPTFYVSVLDAIRIWHRGWLSRASLCAFPRCAIELFSITSSSMEQAQFHFEIMLCNASIF
ncbi:hypothetical protein NLM31_12985 [Bradyrhizobium sp. CCGUVB4N]|uniref:hypothetical protein n=1 Tax=Bradyrhizobium sp. CCGUVB4N TaxID=2949631 RepID=UPI0020B31502|nr:hypothetical protein [Bradyrhizobium sp. CCGUVB4N]MCP3381255.1 hypothetical protein [Bradyrhizobium sp. CCGUVB4N]